MDRSAPSTGRAPGLLRCLVAVGGLLSVIALSGCDSLFGGDDDAPIAGKRVSVLAHERALAPDPGLADTAIVIPPPVANTRWPPPSDGTASQAAHLQLGTTLQMSWRANAGRGLSDRRPHIPPPIVADGRVYTMDSGLAVSAFDAASGDRAWTVDLVTDDAGAGAKAGGLAYADGRVFATTGFGAVVALDAADGTEVWRTSVAAPIHGPPTVGDGRVIAITIDNTVVALSTDDGRRVWPPQPSIAEPAGLLGTPSPALADSMVVAPFSSGEIVAMRADSGRVVWTDSLGSSRRMDDLAFLSDIRATPVIDADQVFAASFAGVLASIDLYTGQRVWERETGGLSPPWLAGRHLFLITGQQDLLCLSRDSGAIVWVTALPRYQDEEEREDPILWYGPILAGQRLILAGSNEQLMMVAPADGQIVTTIDLPAAVSRAPIVAGGTLYVLTDDADLIAFR